MGVEDKVTTHFVEVYKNDTQPMEVVGTTRVIETPYPIGTLVNVGVGPELPEHPYEGQVWIKI